MQLNERSGVISVVLIHPCRVVRHGVGLLLEKEGFQVIGLLDSCESLLKDSIGKFRTDVVIIHYSQCTAAGMLKKIKALTGAHIALMASSDSYHCDSYDGLLEEINEGVSGFLDLDGPVEEFVQQLGNIAAGNLFISKSFVGNMMQKSRHIEENLRKTLSRREVDVINLVAKGNTNREIGEELFISESTVKVHLRSILSKLNLEGRRQLIAYAVKKSFSEELERS